MLSIINAIKDVKIFTMWYVQLSGQILAHINLYHRRFTVL